MPSLYYKKEISIGENGEKLGVLMLDSCLMLCSNWTYSDLADEHLRTMNYENRGFKERFCSDSAFVNKGNEQF